MMDTRRRASAPVVCVSPTTRDLSEMRDSLLPDPPSSSSAFMGLLLFNTLCFYLNGFLEGRQMSTCPNVLFYTELSPFTFPEMF